MKKQICNRCKKELDWEAKEILENAPREELIRLCFGFMSRLKELEKWH